ncbi:hypothetical protein [Paenibacillus thermotolerans]|uniref:hypothetical protein n=1 Tax=Paenibacillus thermotolerans TaxID=3027807 RepID=UPI0023680BFC|nr:MULTISPECIES: hypothetical protein [unclassified Paenibacillus]
MKKIGFIDYFLDEWHANNYPAWIEEASGGSMKVTSAYGKKDSDHGLSNAQWCDKYGVKRMGSIEEVIEDSDYLIVLSPDYPEQHEELAQLPLASGKPTYVDKTFAPDRATAVRLIERAEKFGTPMYSSSALRFASEYTETDRAGIDAIVSIGPGKMDNYSIHQVEPIIALMGSRPVRVMYTGTPKTPSVVIQFEDGRTATYNHIDGPFGMAMSYASGSSRTVKVESNFFQSFMKDLVRFFETGRSIVEPQETISIITVLENALKAKEKPFQWVDLP